LCCVLRLGVLLRPSSDSRPALPAFLPGTLPQWGAHAERTERPLLRMPPASTRACRPRKGWYERQENNGWRPVAERLLLPEGQAKQAAEAAAEQQQQRRRQQQAFHHSPAVRRWEGAEAGLQH
jgi:hypothetical protein